MSETTSLYQSILDRNEAFQEIYPGPTKKDVSVKVHESVSDEAFKATWGMTKEEAYERNLKAVDELFEPEKIREYTGGVFEKGKKIEEKALPSDNTKSMVDAGGVFEKQDKLDEQPRFSEKANKGSGNINWGDFYDESDTMDSKKPHLSRQATKPEDLKFYYHDTKDTVTEVKGLDLKEINELKERLETPAQKIKEPSMDSSFGILK
jgi:hypothetical protein